MQSQRVEQEARLRQEEARRADEATQRADEATRRADEATQCAEGQTRLAEEAAQLARARFDAGVTDFLVVLDAEREVLTNRDQLVQAQADTATSLVGVYRALGGGWTAPEPAVAAVAQ